ncbi:MAG: HU family DNA-binding protein [Armatimonadota bacterium]|nr:HU family DNA-binding protein [Armatimonadota bacterium]MCX7776796.1 HU family DNA-binding protein [Armatimonadota bacterium]MDW8024592.1 HU family DNA-binding protein [Armatimonadota bacterium]
MNKSDIIKAVAEAVGLKRADASKAVDTVFSCITQALSGRKKEPVNIAGFGIFKVRKTKKRTARNPQTGEPIEIPARTVPVFRPAKAFKEAVQK